MGILIFERIKMRIFRCLKFKLLKISNKFLARSMRYHNYIIDAHHEEWNRDQGVSIRITGERNVP